MLRSRYDRDDDKLHLNYSIDKMIRQRDYKDDDGKLRINYSINKTWCYIIDDDIPNNNDPVLAPKPYSKLKVKIFNKAIGLLNALKIKIYKEMEEYICMAVMHCRNPPEHMQDFISKIADLYHKDYSGLSKHSKSAM
jgi:hypothetical protein